VAAVRRGLVLMPSDLIDLFAIAYAAALILLACWMG
jgi:hypothetical protein